MIRRTKSQPIRDGVVQALQGAGGIFTETSEAVSRVIREACGAAQLAGASAAEAIDQVVQDALRGIEGTDDDAAIAIKGITVGVIRGTRESGAEASATLARIAGTIIHETLRKGGDLAQASRGLLTGVRFTANELGMDVGLTTLAAARAAAEAAEELSAPEARKLREAVDQAIQGIQVNLGHSDRSQSHR